MVVVVAQALAYAWHIRPGNIRQSLSHGYVPSPNLHGNRQRITPCYNCDSTTIRLRFDYDVSRAPGSIRRKQKIKINFRRSHIIVLSQSNRTHIVILITFVVVEWVVVSSYHNRVVVELQLWYSLKTNGMMLWSRKDKCQSECDIQSYATTSQPIKIKNCIILSKNGNFERIHSGTHSHQRLISEYFCYTKLNQHCHKLGMMTWLPVKLLGTSWHCNDLIGNLHVTIWYEHGLPKTFLLF